MIVVYSALLGDVTRDIVAAPPAGCDAKYVLFTNGPAVEGWERVEVSATLDRSPRMTARLLKANPELWFPNVDATVWIDAGARLLRPVADLVRLGDAVAAFRHHRRGCLADEGRAVARRDARHDEAVARQLGEYRRLCFDPDAPRAITVTGLLVRRGRDVRVRAFNEVWQAQLMRHTLRDQLSIDYAAWSTDVTIHHLSRSYVNNSFVRFGEHACPTTSR